MIFVTGATGKVGRHVVSGLLERGAAVPALVRDPDAADLPVGIEMVRGDLSDPQGLAEHLNGVDAVFLVWPFFTEEGAGEVVDTLGRQTPRIIYLSAEAAAGRPNSFWAAVERAIERSADDGPFCDRPGSPPTP